MDETLINLFIDRNSAKIEEYLKNKKYNITKVIINACLYNMIDIIKFVFQQKENIELEKEESILDYACSSGNIEIVKFVLDKYKNIDLRSKNKNNERFIDSAFENGCCVSQNGNNIVEIIEFLIKTFPDINIQTKKGFYYSIIFELKELIEWFIAKCPELIETNDKNIFSYACKTLNENFVEWILQKFPNLQYDLEEAFTLLIIYTLKNLK